MNATQTAALADALRKALADAEAARRNRGATPGAAAAIRKLREAAALAETGQGEAAAAVARAAISALRAAAR